MTHSIVQHRPEGGCGTRCRRSVLLALALVLLATVAAGPAHAGQVVSVETTGVSSGAVFSVTAIGLDAVAANNLVTIAPAGGAPVMVAAASTIVVDAARGVRRLSLRVPGGLEVGPAAASVRNVVTNETIAVGTIQLLALVLPDYRQAAPGTTGLEVVVRARGNAAFVGGQTRVTFGAGITVRAVTVLASNELRATIDVAATAAQGPRTVSVTVPRQSLVLPAGFNVAAQTTPNQAPVARFTVTPASAEAGAAGAVV